MRKPRHLSDESEATYHVLSRAAQQEFIFTDEVKRIIVEPWFRVYQDVFYVDIHSDTLMTNHGHGLITVYKPEYDYEDLKRRFLILNANLSRPRKWHPGRAKSFYNRITSLSSFMQAVKWRISWEYNRANGTKGHVWDGPFKSIEVKGDQQKTTVDTYIQQNPVRAKMVEKPSEYPHCTAGRIKAALDQGREVDAPEFGLFEKIKDRISRCKAYVAYQDWVAHLINNPSARQEMAPPEVIALAIPVESWETVRLEIKNRVPVAWGKQTYEAPQSQEWLNQSRPPP